ncbi:MAG: hypothetical protein HYY57_02095 [Candidatus Omnitrophica bacterium]|nr:hypothetical protein [Candidatus Omnitrophota bacterium]
MKTALSGSRKKSFHRGVGLFEALAVMVLIGWVGVSFRQGQAASIPLLKQRSQIYQLSTTLRAMRWWALTGGDRVELRTDPAHNRFQVVTVEENQGLEHVLRTIWLTPELQIVDAPPSVMAFPNGTLTKSSIVIASPSFQRLFHLSTTPSGSVEFLEEPTS